MSGAGEDGGSVGSTDRSDATRPTPPRLIFPGFEGLRALAATVVVLHHSASLVGDGPAGPVAEPAAVMDIGVSIFFVLSGFLIYRPFAVAHLQGTPGLRWRTFWWRRVLRIVPAYWAALSIMWALGWFHLGREWWRYYFFLQIYDPFTTLGGIVPAWSLDTEMAFYLFVPFFALAVGWAVARAGRGRAGLGLELAGVAALMVAGAVSRVIISGSERVWVELPGRAPVTMREVSFSWLPNNIDLFAIGMGTAVLSAWCATDAGAGLKARLDRLTRPAGAWWAAAVVLFAWFAYRVGPPQFNGGYKGLYWQQRQWSFGLIALCLLLPCVFGPHGHGVVRRALRWRPIAWLGVVSYGLYLWHQDLLEQVPGWLDEPPTSVPLLTVFIAGMVLGTIAAAASWYGLERPLQQRFKRRF